MKVKIKGIVHWHKYAWEDAHCYQIYDSDMSCCGPEFVPIKEVEVEVEIPDDFDPRPVQVANLRKKRDDIRVKAQEEVNNIDEQIQRLLCLELKPEVVA